MLTHLFTHRPTYMYIYVPKIEVGTKSLGWMRRTSEDVHRGNNIRPKFMLMTNFGGVG